MPNQHVTFPEIKSKSKISSINIQSSSHESHSHTDVLAHVTQMCKESSECETPFVRSVECAPESVFILATDQQLVDTERFCTGDVSSVFSVDQSGCILCHSDNISQPSR